MPRVFKVTNIPEEEKELRKDYFDRHMPHIICDPVYRKGEKFKVKVRVGENYSHPDESDHYIKFIQLWDLETFIAETQFAPSAFGGKPVNAEVDFYLYPQHTLRLSAVIACTKHGMWMSKEIEIPTEG